MAQFETIQEIVLSANRRIAPDLWDSIMGGTESETTLCRNRQALDSLAFRPRVSRDVSNIDTSSVFLGHNLRIPVLFAPVGQLDRICPEATRYAVETASEFGALCCLSSINEFTLEEATGIAKGHFIFQLYLQGGESWLDAFLDRVEQAEPLAFCLTVDTALYSRRERDLFNRYSPPGREEGERDGFEYQTYMNWQLVAKVRDRLNIPIILKGIATAEDAGMCVEHGVDVVYVSNHGGRQLDHGRGTMDVLAEVIDAVAGQAEVLVDGGFVRGSDVIKAIALGARAVGLGKLQALALAAAEREGLIQMLEILENEITTSMGLLGVTRLDQLDPSYIEATRPAKYPDPFSPFPSLKRRNPLVF